MVSSTIVAAVDVGSVSKLGWWRAELGSASGSSGGHHLEDLVAQLAKDLEKGCRVALGFEAPLFLPVPGESAALGRRRQGEGNRPWSAAAGAVVTALAAQQVAWTLAAIARHCRDRPLAVGFDPSKSWMAR